MSGVTGASTDEKPAAQQSGAGDTPSNHKALQLLECIVISDSDEESWNPGGQTRSMSVGHSDASSSERGDPEEQTRNMSSDAAAMLPGQLTRHSISSRKTVTANILIVNQVVALLSMQAWSLQRCAHIAFSMSRNTLTAVSGAGGQCVVCRERALLKDLHQCGSCDKLLHERCAASLPVPLSQYCFFCKGCKKQPHQRGALLEVQDAYYNLL